jgi:hypothetical protein
MNPRGEHWCGLYIYLYGYELEKIWFFGVKSWFFTRNTPKISHLTPQLEKNWFFGVKSWFFTRNIPKMFNATFKNISFISWWSVLLVEETGVPRENHRPVASQKWHSHQHKILHRLISSNSNRKMLLCIQFKCCKNLWMKLPLNFFSIQIYIDSF